MRITLAPNTSSEPTGHLPDYIDEVQLYAHTLDRPTYGRPWAIEAGAIKEYDCFGEILLADLDRLAETGATRIAADEPLVAAIKPDWKWGWPWPHGHCFDGSGLPSVVSRVGEWIAKAKGLGFEVSIIESLQQHPRSRLWNYLTGVHAIAPFDRLVIDYDPRSRFPEYHQLRYWAMLKGFCKTRGVELVPIVMGYGEPVTEEAFEESAMRCWHRLRRYGPWERVVVQSWHPLYTMPSTDVLVRIAGRIRDERQRDERIARARSRERAAKG